MVQSLLPNILDVAKRNHLEVNQKTLNKKEIRFKCPFCHADANKKNKYYLSINEEKNVFKCWYCKENGGVLRFISLLEGKSEQELIEEIRNQKGSTYKKHPAERLTRSQLELIGYPKIDWIKNREFDYHLYKAFRDKVWNEWKAFVRNKKRFSYQLLFVGLISGDFKNSVEQVREIEKELNVTFLDDLLASLFQERKNDQLFQVEDMACKLSGCIHPYETYLVENNEDKGEDFKMLNVCTFVGRLSSDVELRYTPNGKPVAIFNLALNRPVPDQNNERHADFIRCLAWGKVAENMANQLSKGDTIGIQSKVQTRSYDNQKGQKVYVTEFVVEGFPTFLKVRKWENPNSNNNNGNSKNGNGKNNNHNNDNGGNAFYNDPFAGNGNIDFTDDDLPF